MARVLIVKNIPSEGPGTIGEFLAQQGLRQELEFSQGQRPSLPLARYSHLVLMGGPMAVYEMHRHLFLQAELELLREFLRSGRAVLGVCLGAQLMAHALGARVYAGPQKEIGWYRVHLTPQGLEDPVLGSLAEDGQAVVFQWHGDTFELPRGAVLLASSELYAHQAFRWGRRAYALQFHIEVTPGMLRDWFSQEEGFDLEAILQETHRLYPAYRQRAWRVYQQFFLS